MVVNFDGIEQRKNSLAWLNNCLDELGVKRHKLADFGCAKGVGTIGLAWAVGVRETVGIDIDEDSIAAARKLAKDARREKTELANVSFQLTCGDMVTGMQWLESGSFDIAHCERVLEKEWCDGDDQSAAKTRKAIREMARVLRPGGVVVAIEAEWCDGEHPEKRLNLEPLFDEIEEMEKVWVKSRAELKGEQERRYDSGHLARTWVYLYQWGRPDAGEARIDHAGDVVRGGQEA